MDIALGYDAANGTFDFVLENGDLAVDDGLYTAVALSICSDRLANADDPIPDGGGDRRGTWMDTPFGAADETGNPTDQLAGSRLWLLGRAKQTQENLNLGIQYLQECLQWLLDDGVAAGVAVTGSFPALGTGVWTVAIAQEGANGVASTQTFNIYWSATLGVRPPVAVN